MSINNLTDFFKSIKHTYPESYKAFTKWLQRCADEGRYMQPVVDSAIKFDMYIYLNIRDLYDFFDDVDLYVEIMHSDEYSNDPSERHADTDSWFYSVADIEPSNDEFDRYYTSRKHAEAGAFARGFEILEQRL